MNIDRSIDTQSIPDDYHSSSGVYMLCKICQSHEPINITCLVGVKSIWTLKPRDAILFIKAQSKNKKSSSSSKDPISTKWRKNRLINSNGCNVTMILTFCSHLIRLLSVHYIQSTECCHILFLNSIQLSRL